MPTFYRALLPVFASISFAAPGSLAQTRLELSPEAKGRFEASCGSRAAAFASAERTLELRQALRMMALCPDTGAHILAGEWALKSRDTGYVQAIADASKRLIDRRIAHATLGIASDRSLSWELRFAALDALASQISPTLSLRTGRFVQYAIRSVHPPHDVVSYGITTDMGSSTPNESFTLGREQLTNPEREAISAAVARIATEDSSMASHVLAVLTLAERYRLEVPVREVRPIR